MSALATRAVTPRLRLGFIGLGWIGRRRLDALATNADVEIAAVVDNDPHRLESTAAAYPDAVSERSLEAILDADVDGVVIATPNGLHAEQALMCLDRGVPVFCQKPLATTAADVRRIIDSAASADCLLGIDFCYRHLAGMDALRGRIRSGDLGEIVAIDARFHNAYGPDKAWCRDPRLAGGGCLLDLGVHLVDLALWLQDFPPLERVRSRLFSNGVPLQSAGHEVEDLAYAEFIQSSGAIVRLACSWHAHAGRDAVIDMTIAGTRGGAGWSNVNGSFYDFELELYRGSQSERLGGAPDDWGTRALRSWADRLRVDRHFDPQAEQIARSAVLIDEIYHA